MEKEKELIQDNKFDIGDYIKNWDGCEEEEEIESEEYLFDVEETECPGENELDEIIVVSCDNYDEEAEAIQKLGRGKVLGEYLTEYEKNVLAEKNMGLIKHICKIFSNTGLSQSDLMGVAIEGFVKALNKYKNNKKTKFTTFAYRCMFNEILAFLRREKKWFKKIVSMQAPIGTDKNGNVLDLEKVLDDDSKTLDEVVIGKDLDSLVLSSLSVLNEQERFIMIHRFGLQNKEEKTQGAIAEELGISQAYVSKLEKDCMAKIKRFIQEEDLKNGILGKNEYFNY